MRRRVLPSIAVAAVARGQSQTRKVDQFPQPVTSGEDRFHEIHGSSYSSIAFKVATRDSQGALFVIEHTFRRKGGPPRHLHPHQDEWFYVMKGKFLFDVGDTRTTLRTGDSILGPRNVPHVWACIGSGSGKLLISCAPAGKMEEFFREMAVSDGARPLDATVFRKYDMELVGPRLSV